MTNEVFSYFIVWEGITELSNMAQLLLSKEQEAIVSVDLSAVRAMKGLCKGAFNPNSVGFNVRF